MPVLDLDSMRLDLPAPTRASRRPLPRHRQGELFLRGPIPLSWLIAASRLPGRALELGVMLWHQGGCENNAIVRPSLAKIADQVGCDRTTLSRALRALEKAGLVAVERGAGRIPLVEVLYPQTPQT